MKASDISLPRRICGGVALLLLAILFFSAEALMDTAAGFAGAFGLIGAIFLLLKAGGFVED